MKKSDSTLRKHPLPFTEVYDMFVGPLGLKENSTSLQLSRGTRSFHDPVTKVDYVFYLNGYFRRFMFGGFTGHQHVGYQLNPKTRHWRNLDYKINGYYGYWATGERILAPFKNKLNKQMCYVLPLRKVK